MKPLNSIYDEIAPKTEVQKLLDVEKRYAGIYTQTKRQDDKMARLYQRMEGRG